VSGPLFERLETFLGALADRQAALIREAEVGFEGLREEFPDDPLPTGNALTGLRAQASQLRERVDEVWEQQIEALFSARAPTALDRARDRKEDAKRSMEDDWRRFEARVLADFYRALRPRMEASLAQPVACSRCSASLRPSGVRRTEAVTCRACGAVSQVMPQPAVAHYFGGAGHALAEEATLPLRLRIEADRTAADRARRSTGWAPEPLASLEAWEQAEQAYWDAYGRARAAATGDPVDAAFVESRMQAFRRAALETDPRWRRHRGRP
jgi:hypothetical protein